MVMSERQSSATSPAPATLTKEEAGLLVGVHPRTLERLAAVGKAPAPIRIGARVVWYRETLERWLAEQSEAAQAGTL